jgi:hypothetical protein
MKGFSRNRRNQAPKAIHTILFGFTFSGSNQFTSANPKLEDQKGTMGNWKGVMKTGDAAGSATRTFKFPIIGVGAWCGEGVLKNPKIRYGGI